MDVTWSYLNCFASHLNLGMLSKGDADYRPTDFWQQKDLMHKAPNTQYGLS